MLPSSQSLELPLALLRKEWHRKLCWAFCHKSWKRWLSLLLTFCWPEHSLMSPEFSCKGDRMINDLLSSRKIWGFSILPSSQSDTVIENVLKLLLPFCKLHLFIYLFIYSFIYSLLFITFIHLLHLFVFLFTKGSKYQHCARPWKYNGKQDNHGFCSSAKRGTEITQSPERLFNGWPCNKGEEGN